MGGFLKCLLKIKEDCAETGIAMSPSQLESELSDNFEGDDYNSDHEVKKVNRTTFVPNYRKGSKQKWLPQSFLDMRAQCPDYKAPKSRAIVWTSSKSSVDSLSMEQEKQHEMHELLASCSDAEHSDSAHYRHRPPEQTQRNSIEALSEAANHIEHDDNASSSSQADDIVGLENTVSDLQSENTAECVEEISLPVLSDSLLTSKQKRKKHKLKVQNEGESGADNVHSVEVDQFNESQTTEMTLKRTKKKRKDKERTKTAQLEDNIGTETCEAAETEQPEYIQASEEISELKSVRKKKKKRKKNDVEESPYESVDVNLVSQSDNVTDRSTAQATVEERPSDVLEHTEFELNDAEHSGFVQCAKNLHGDNLFVIEDGQGNSMEAEQAVEHEDTLTSDKNLPDKSSSLLPPQGGDISIQKDIQQTDSDCGSEDLFSPMNSPKHKSNQIDKAASITANLEESDQDSDVTQIETEGQFESIFGEQTPRWCDGDRRTYEESEETQIETEGKLVSVFGPGTPNERFTTNDMNNTKHPESQKTDQAPIGLNKKRKNVSRSHKDSDVIDVEETKNVQPSSKHLPLAGEPLKEVCPISSESLNLSRQRSMEEMETNPQDTPMFKNGGLSFIKRKRKVNKELGATNFIQCDLNADVGFKSAVDYITGVKTTSRASKKSHEVENEITNEEQRNTSVLHLEETSENLEESVADNSAITKVKRKKKKRHKLEEHEAVEPSEENQSVETVQFSESQTAEKTSKITKKKKKKDKVRTKLVYEEENSAIDIPSNETLPSGRSVEVRINDQSSEVPQMFVQTSEEITGCTMSNVTTLKPVKKKKKKRRDETEEPEYESVDLDVSSVSQFTHDDGALEQQLTEERPIDYDTAEHLERNTPLILKAAKHKKKGQNVSSSDDIIGLEKQVSGSQSDSTKVVLEKKKKQKCKEQNNVELASDIRDNVHLFQQSESPTTDSLSRKRKKKRANKDRERTTDSSSNEIFYQMHDRHSEIKGNNVIVATKTSPFEHLQTSEEITRCSSPSVTKLSSGKKEKKKKDRSEKRKYDFVDVNLDASQLDVVSGLMGQKMIERRPSNGSAVEHLEGNTARMLKVAKRKKSSLNVSSSQVDDMIGLENTVSDLQSENTAERVEEINSPVSKRKKKKKHKLKVQEEVESGADNVRSVEMDQFSESQTTEMTLKRTKKKRKDKERTKTAQLEDNIGTETCETCEAAETEQPEHIQASEEISELKSVRKKKKKRKKNDVEESLYESVDVNLVSQSDNVTDRSTAQATVEESDALEHTQAELNSTKHKKKRKQSSLSVNNGSEFSSSGALMQEAVAPERKRKKKRNSDHVTNVGGELISESSDHSVLFEKSQSQKLKSLESITKKSKKRKNKEMNESIYHIPDHSVQLEAVQTTRTDSIIQHNSADRQTDVIIPLGGSEDIRKKKKKRKKETENNITEISMF